MATEDKGDVVFTAGFDHPIDHGDYHTPNLLKLTDLRFDMQALFPMFLDRPSGEQAKVLPSTFIREMQLSTEERLEKLIQPLKRHFAQIWRQPSHPPRSFQLVPSIIVFQNFEVGKAYTVTLGVRNIVEGMKGLRMHCEHSPLFKVCHASTHVYSKVAPGITIQFTATFLPTELRDYKHSISFETEEEAFVVPIIAIGPRPLLDFPDHVDIAMSAVKIPSTKLLLVRNIGQVVATFNLITDSPFSVEPSKGVLDPKEAMQVVVTFASSTVGAFLGELRVKYETGENLYVSLSASAENVIVHLDQKSLRFDDTFMGLKRQKTITMHNKSDHIVSFKWKKLQTLEQELDHMKNLKDVFQVLKEHETKKAKRLEYYDIIDSEGNELVYDRIYNDEVNALKTEDFSYSSPIFSIIPLSGEVWPNGSVDMIVVFAPTRGERYEAEAYCEVTGRDERLVLDMLGNGKGPQMIINVNILDIDFIFLCSKHSYEVVVANKGDIPGRVDFLPKEFTFGGRAHCSPHHLFISPGESQTFIITFSSNRQGSFVETVDFIVHESAEVISFLLKGNVVSPTLHFNKTLFNYKDVPIGFHCVRHLQLTNLSMVPVHYNLRVMYDGTTPSYTHTMFAALKQKPSLPINPKEFDIHPNEGVVPAYSDIKITLTLTPNIARNWSTALIVDMWDSNSESVSLPLKFNARFPQITCSPNEVKIQFCFINFPYTRSIILENTSLLPGYFYILPQEEYSSETMKVSFSLTEGIIRPQSRITVVLTITVSSMGKHDSYIRLLTLGEKHPQHVCRLLCTGQGPVISSNQSTLNWGKTKLLETSTLSFKLTNDSPIPAEYTSLFPKANTPWSISPKEGLLLAEESVTLLVSVYLVDSGHYAERLEIIVPHSRTIVVELRALGVGSSIVMEPPICPQYNMGSVFRHEPIRREVKIINMGKRHHQLTWISHGDFYQKSLVHKKSMDSFVEPSYVFQVSPAKLFLEGGETGYVYFDGQCTELTSITESFMCHAVIGHKGPKRLLMESAITATFIDPVITFTKEFISFRIDIKSNEPFEIVKNTFGLSNLSNELALTVTCEIEYPFMMSLGDEEDDQTSKFRQTRHLTGATSTSIDVYFDPSYLESLYSHVARGVLRLKYKEHPQKDTISVRGEVNFPNVSVQPRHLDFASVPLGSQACKEILLTNTSPLPVTYLWYWEKTQFRDNTDVSSAPVKEPQNNESVMSRFVTHPKSSRHLCCEDGHSLDSRKVKISDVNFDENVDENNARTPQTLSSIEVDVKSSGSLAVRAEPLLRRLEAELDPGRIQELRDKLWPLIHAWFDVEQATPILEKLPRQRPQLEQVKQLFDITPFYGKLDPKESQIISISFDGQYDVTAEATAICVVEGGPTESVTITAVSSNVSFNIDRSEIDFGRRVFCDLCEETLTISNNGKIAFDFVAVTNDPPENFKHIMLEPGFFYVQPKSGNILSKEDIQLRIKMFPGIPGKFEKTFLLEIGYLRPLVITLKGHGVLPQLHVWLPRPVNLSTPCEVGYTAIATINKVSDSGHDQKKVQQVCSYSCTERLSSLMEISKNSQDGFKKHGWGIVSKEDQVPTVREIDLAIERTQACNHLANNPFPLTDYPYDNSNCYSIPEFVVAPYLIDFGLVVMNTTSTFSACLENLGSVPATVCLVPLRHPRCCVSVVFKETTLQPKEMTVLQFTFAPALEHYPLNYQTLDYEVSLEVKNGARIRIDLRAVVTFPFVTLSTKELNFETVLCTECKLIKVLVKNIGWVKCSWTAVLVNKTQARNTSPELQRQILSAFTLKYASGTLNPKSSSYMEVTFQPVLPIVHEVYLKVVMDHNPAEVKIKVTGEGFQPCLKLSHSTFTYSPCLPYCYLNEQVLTIENPCAIPVEFFFPYGDSTIVEEEPILRVLSHYYDSNELYLPVRKPGEKLSDIFYKFYEMMITKLNAKKAQEQLERDRLEKPSSWDDLSTDTHKKGKRKATHPNVTKKLGTTGSFTTITGSEIPSLRPSTPMPFTADKTPAEIEAGIHALIDEMSISDRLVLDPIKGALQATVPAPPPVDPTCATDGVFIIFHGAPETDFHHAANRVARSLDLTVLNVDQTILAAAAFPASRAALKVADLINAAYDGMMLDMDKKKKSTSSDKLIDTDNDPLESMILKVNALHHNKAAIRKTSITKKKEPEPKKDLKPEAVKSPVGNKKSLKDSKSSKAKKSSSKHSQHSTHSTGAQGDTEILAAIPVDLILEIFRERLQMADCRNGVTVDGLTSLIFNNDACSMLTMLLGAAGNIKFIQLIVFMNSLESHVEHLLRTKSAHEGNMTTEFKSKVEYLQSLSDDELLSEEDKIIFNRIKLKERREHWIRRHEGGDRHVRQKKLSIIKPAVIRTLGKSAKSRKQSSPMQTVADGKYTKVGSRDSHSVTSPVDKTKPASKPHLPRTIKSSDSKVKRDVSKTPSKFNTPRTNAVKKDKTKYKVGIPDGLGIEDPAKLRQQFEAYETYFSQLLPLLENWDRTRGLVVGLEPPVEEKPKVNKKAEKREKGEKSEKAEKGEKGEKVEKGEKGEKGEKQEKGEKGGKGEKGASLPLESTTEPAKPPAIKASDLNLTAEQFERWQLLLGVPIWVVDSRNPDNRKTDALLRILKQTKELKEAQPGPLKDDESQHLKQFKFFCVQSPAEREPQEYHDSFSLKFVKRSLTEDVLMTQPDDYLAHLERQLEFTSVLEFTRMSTTSFNLDDDARSSSSRSSFYSSRTSIVSAKRTPSTIKRKSRKKKTPKSTAGKQEEQGLGTGANSFQRRWVLDPGEKLTWKMCFQPRTIGTYSQRYNLELVGWSTRYSFQADGVCDIPSLLMDPQVMFPKVEAEKSDDHIYTPTYFLNKCEFDLGAVLIPKLSKDTEYVGIVTTFSLTTSSTVPADIILSCLDLKKMGEENFIFQPQHVTIAPGCTEKISVRACPRSIGKITETLVLSIKNNPQLEYISLVCYGCECEFDTDTRSITFDHMLLYRHDSRNVTMFNKCLVPLIWKFANLAELSDDISISDTSGLIGPLEEKMLTFTYEAKHVQVITNKVLRLELFELLSCKVPIYTLELLLSAEAFDVMVDFKFLNPTENFVNFGKIIVGKEYKQAFQMTNIGKYDVTFRFQSEDIVGLPNKEAVFKIQPNKGTLLRDAKPLLIQVVYTPEIQFLVNNVVFQCYVYDTLKENTVVGTIPIRVLAETFCSLYKVLPVPDINFGPMPLGTSKEMMLSIENTGNYEFKYKITQVKISLTHLKSKKGGLKSSSRKLAKGKSRTGSKTSSESKKSIEGKSSKRPKSKIEFENSKTTVKGKKATSSKISLVTKVSTSKDLGGVPKSPVGKGKVKQVAVIPLRMGPFLIKDSSGMVKPGETVAVVVECLMAAEGSVTEKVVVHISEEPTPKLGCTVELQAIGAVPLMDFSDVARIFQEQFLCDSLAEFKCADEVEGHGVYVKSASLLRLDRVCVGTVYQTSLRFHNDGLVPCDLTIKVTPAKNGDNTPAEKVFGVTPLRVTIAPFTVETLDVTFAPTLLEEYKATVEISLEMPVPNRSSKMTFELEGEGITPQVTITAPKVLDNKGQTLVNLRPTAVGQTSTKHLVFKNTGLISCKVIVELYNNSNGLFTLYPTQETSNLLLPWGNSDVIRHTTIVKLVIAQSASFIIKFDPKEKGKQGAELRMYIVDNPFENKVILVSAESYVEDITLDGLYKDVMKDRSLVLNQDDDDPEPPAYHIDFGGCYMSQTKKQCFKVANRSEVDTYRCEWSLNPLVTICPALSHIKPRMSKETIITFKSAEPVKLQKMVLQCEVSKITYPDGCGDLEGWDDRISSLQFVSTYFNDSSQDLDGSQHELVEVDENSLMVSQLTVEPKHEVVLETTRSIKLMISAESGYASYTCSAQDIKFEDTLMFQTLTQTFTLKNTSNIHLTYDWDIIVAHELIKRPSVTALRFLCLNDSALTLATHKEYPMSIPSFDSAWPSNRSNALMLDKSLREPSLLHATQSDYSNRFLDGDVLSHSMALPVRSSGTPLQSQRSTERYSRPYTASVTAGRAGDGDTRKIARPLTAHNGFLADLQTSTKTASHYFVPVDQRKSVADMDFNPFHVEPTSGRLEKGEEIHFTVKFAPLDVLDYTAKLVCNIPNLLPGLVAPQVCIKGRSLMPFAHFDIGESDYVSSGRRDKSLPGPHGLDVGSSLPSETRVIELSVLGVGTVFSKKFKLINPSNTCYSFSWVNADAPCPKDVTVFNCVTTDGWMDRGKHTDIEFQFTPRKAGTFESFWNFLIPDHNIQIPFLLVATASFPSVSFVYPHLKLTPTLVGFKTERVVGLVNKEDIPLKFSFVADSLFSQGRAQCLEIVPMAGVLAPHKEEPISVAFTPTLSGDVTFHLKCSVKKLDAPLVLGVETVCYVVQPTAFYEDVNTKKRVMLSHTHANVIDVGPMVPKFPVTIAFHVTNIGKISFFYAWNYDEGQLLARKVKLTIREESGQVTPESRVSTTMNIAKLAKTSFKNIPVDLEIRRGPMYRLLLNSTACQPMFHFSFSDHNFGPMFIPHSDVSSYVAKLLFTNNDDSALVVESTFVNLPHLKMLLPKEPVPPKTSVNIPIEFRPLARCKYNETLVFLINGEHERKITVAGEGIDIKMSLVNPNHKIVSLGALHVGQTVCKTIPVTNKAQAPITCKFSFCERLGVVSSEVDLPSLEHVLQVSPSTKVIIKPMETVNVIVKFAPVARLKPFTTKVCIKFSGCSEPLFIVKGCCVGNEFTLNRTCLPFGAVIKGCTAQLKVALVNSGDIGAKFHWPVSKFDAKNFSIFPTHGYCSPGMEVPFTVSFHPTALKVAVRNEVECHIENLHPLPLVLAGSCISIPPPKETVNFSTPVRQSENKSIVLQNKTNQALKTFPLLTGEYYTGADIILLPPHSDTNYVVTYSPLAMSRDGEIHKGSVFFELSDGQGLMYELLGTAEPPSPIASIARVVLCKTSHMELLPVSNWLRSMQRFSVNIEYINGGKVENFHRVDGSTYLDVPGNGVRDYQLNFFAYKEADMNFKVTFTNAETGEYQFYDVQFSVAKCNALAQITMATCVRQPVVHQVKLENPLDKTVTFMLSSPALDLTFPATQVVDGKAAESVAVEFCPLQPGDSYNNLNINSSDLGLYPYDLKLTAEPAPDEKPTTFNVSIGSKQTKEIAFQNMAKVKADFICKIDEAQFQVEQQMSVNAGSRGLCSVTYEPTALGSLQDTLFITSSTAGDYVFPLIGNCVAPKPQGPFLVKEGTVVIIPFKNVFPESKEYNLYVDQPAFTVTNTTQLVEATQVCNIEVGLDTSQNDASDVDARFPVTGKLVVTCVDPQLADIKWTFYLKGIVDKE